MGDVIEVPKPTERQHAYKIAATKIAEDKPVKKVCPLVQSECINERCMFFADKDGLCGIQVAIVASAETYRLLEGAKRLHT